MFTHALLLRYISLFGTAWNTAVRFPINLVLICPGIGFGRAHPPSLPYIIKLFTWGRTKLLSHDSDESLMFEFAEFNHRAVTCSSRQYALTQYTKTWRAVHPKRKLPSIIVHMMCAARVENELRGVEWKNSSEDLTSLSDGAKGPAMNNTWAQGEETDVLAFIRPERLPEMLGTLALMGLQSCVWGQWRR